MRPRHVRITTAAERERVSEKVPESDWAAMRRKFRMFAETGVGDVRKLDARTDEWALRHGRWRAGFTFDHAHHAIVVLWIRTRRDAYR